MIDVDGRALHVRDLVTVLLGIPEDDFTTEYSMVEMPLGRDSVQLLDKRGRRLATFSSNTRRV